MVVRMTRFWRDVKQLSTVRLGLLASSALSASSGPLTKPCSFFIQLTHIHSPPGDFVVCVALGINTKHQHTARLEKCFAQMQRFLTVTMLLPLFHCPPVVLPSAPTSCWVNFRPQLTCRLYGVTSVVPKTNDSRNSLHSEVGCMGLCDPF